MYQFTGEYRVKIDSKGRLKMPQALIDQIDDDLVFTVNRGFEKHLMLYPKAVWEKKTKEINRLNIYNTKQRQAIRYFYRGATEMKADSADRLLVPKSLLDYARIEKEVVLFAYHEQIEIWAEKMYDQVLSEEPEEFADIADEIFGNLGDETETEKR
jgi:MraZ protein